MTKALAIKRTAILILASMVALPLTGRIGVAGEKDQFKWSWSLKIAGGLRYITVGDINRHIKSFDDYMSKAILYYHESGRMKGVARFGPCLEADVLAALSPRLALGLGTGYIWGSKKTELETVGSFPFTLPPWHPYLMSFTIEPKVKAVPIRLGIYYSMAFGPRANFILHGGLGYYFAKGYLAQHNLNIGIGEVYYFENPEISTTVDVSGNALGVHGGAGFEYRLTRSIFIVIEAEGRYAKIGNLKGTLNYWNTWNNDREIANGTLYIGTRDMTDAGYGPGCPDLAVSPLPNMRKATLDFSGFSLTAGFRIGLF